MNEYGSNVFRDQKSAGFPSRQHLSKSIWKLHLTFTVDKRGNGDEDFDKLNTWSYGMAQVANIMYQRIDIQSIDGGWRSMTMDDAREVYPKQIKGSQWMDYASPIVWSP